MLCPCCNLPLATLEDVEPIFHFPDRIAAMTEEEREKRCILQPDTCAIDWRDEHKSQQFIRCVMPFPVHGRERPFHWGVWAAVPRKIFLRYVHLVVDEQEGREIDLAEYDVSWPATLANDLAQGASLKRSTLGHVVYVSPAADKTRPRVRYSNKDHEQGSGLLHLELAVLQRDGVSVERTMEWLKPFHAMLAR